MRQLLPLCYPRFQHRGPVGAEKYERLRNWSNRGRGGGTEEVTPRIEQSDARRDPFFRPRPNAKAEMFRPASLFPLAIARVSTYRPTVRFYGAQTSRIPAAVLLAGALLCWSKSSGAQTPDPVKRFRAVEAFTVELEVVSDDHMHIDGPAGIFKDQKFKERFATRISLTERHVDIDNVTWTGEAIAHEDVLLERKSRDGSWETQHVQSAQGSGKTRVVLYIDESKKTWQISAVEVPSVPGEERVSARNLVTKETTSGQGPIELQAAGLRWLGKEYPLPSAGLVLSHDASFPIEDCGKYLGDWDTAMAHWEHPHGGRIRVAAGPRGIDEPCLACGSVIGIENQSLGQVMDIQGTPFSLNYKSGRGPVAANIQNFGRWTLSAQHRLVGNRLFLGNGEEQTVRQDPSPVRDSNPGSSLPSYYLVPSADGTEMYAFDGAGDHLKTFDALTGSLLYDFRYDANKRLIAVINTYKQVTTVERNEKTGLPVAVIGPYHHRTRLEFDDGGNLTGIINPLGARTSFAYTGTGLMTKLTDPRGFNHSYEYNSSGKLIGATAPSGGSTKLSNSGTSNDFVVSLRTASGRNAQYRSIDKSEGITEKTVTFPDGTMNHETKWEDGKEQVKYANGLVETRSAQSTLAGNHLAPFPDIVTMTLPDGLSAKTTSQRSVTLADPTVPLIVSSVVDSVDFNGAVARSVYTRSDLTLKETSPTGRQRITVFDQYGKVVKRQVEGLSVSTFMYDDKGRLISRATETPGEKLQNSYSYDEGGNLRTITDAVGRSTTIGYDAIGHKTQIDGPGGITIGFAYDAAGNITRLKPPGRSAHHFEYNAAGFLVKYSPPSLANAETPTLYKYNTVNQPTEVIYPGGRTIALHYDLSDCACGRLSHLEEPRGRHKYAYNQTTGQLSSVSSPGDVVVSFAYNGIFPVSEAWSGPIRGKVQEEHDQNFRVVSRKINDANPIIYKADADGLLTHAGSLQLARNPSNGFITGIKLEKTSEAIVYNSRAKKTSSVVDFSGSPLYRAQYAYDKLGRISSKLETIGLGSEKWDYSYDEAGRLMAASNGRRSTQYSYDDNGNRLSVAVDKGTPLTASYDEQDRLLQYGNTVYDYAANGELLAKKEGTKTTRYDYDVFGNLISVERAGAEKIEYIIDGNGRRIGKKLNGMLQKGFLYQDDLRIVAELDGNSQVTSRFIYASRMYVPDFMIRDRVTYRIISDNTGSPRIVVDATTGKIVQQLSYDEFGNIIEDSNPGFQPFGFAGGLYDPDTKLTRFGARDYDAAIGRWTTKDPFLFGGFQSNLYVYVANDPLNRKDPSGLGVKVCWTAPFGVKGKAPKPLAHWWLETSTIKMGQAGTLLDTEWVDHSGVYNEREQEDIQCEDYPNVDEDCVNRMAQGKIGIYGWDGICQTAVEDVLKKCNKSPKPPAIKVRWGKVL